MRRVLLAASGAVLVALGVASSARATEPLYTFIPTPPPPTAPLFAPPPTGYLYGPCGLAVDSSGRIYVSDYYHHVIDLYSGTADYAHPDPKVAGATGYLGQLANEDPLDGPCGPAIDSLGNLYVNNYHRNVAKFGPATSFTLGPVFPLPAVDTAHHLPTGVAIDGSNNVYVDHRTYIGVYDSAGNLTDKIGDGGAIGDGYGVAVSGYAGTLGYVYVPDAATNTVKVFDPATDKVNAKAEIKDPFGKPFVSLRDSAIAVDNTTGEILFADNTQPNYTEQPQAIVYSYSAANIWQGQLPYKITDALPPGLAVDNSSNVTTQGRVYVTSGNTSQAGWYAYARGSRVSSTPKASTFSLSLSTTGGTGSGAIAANLAGAGCSSSCETDVRSAAQVTLLATPDPGSSFSGWSGGGCSGTGDCTVTMDGAKSVSAEFEQSSRGGEGSTAAAAPVTTSAPTSTSRPGPRRHHHRIRRHRRVRHHHHNRRRHR